MFSFKMMLITKDATIQLKKRIKIIKNEQKMIIVNFLSTINNNISLQEVI